MGRVFIPTNETFPKTADAVVVGGGIVGVATAFWLSRAGLDTVLVEMRDGLSTLTTAASAECFRAQFTERLLSEALGNVVVTAFDMQTRTPVLFRSQEARRSADQDVLMRDVARATSAAPTFFPPLRMDWGGVEDRILVDGGVFAQNPAMIGYLEAVLQAREAGDADPAPPNERRSRRGRGTDTRAGRPNGHIAHPGAYAPPPPPKARLELAVIRKNFWGKGRGR